MTLEQVRRAAQSARLSIQATGVKPRQTSDGVGIEHALWMLDCILPMTDVAKANRWFGYAQALMCAWGYSNLAAERDRVREAMAA